MGYKEDQSEWKRLCGQWVKLSAGDSSILKTFPPLVASLGLRIPERKTCLASSSVLYFAGQEEAAKKLDLCIAQNELKQGLLLNRNFVNESTH
jgi:hypothetical protein